MKMLMTGFLNTKIIYGCNIMNKKSRNSIFPILLVVYSGASYADENVQHNFSKIKAEDDKVIEICGYDSKKTYKLYVATLDSIDSVHGVSRDNLNTNIKNLLKTNYVDKCVSITKLSAEIVDHYTQTLNSNIP